MSLAEDEPRRGSVSSGGDDQSETTSTNDVAKQATEASTTDTEADEEPSVLNLKFANALREEGQDIDDEMGADEFHQDPQHLVTRDEESPLTSNCGTSSLPENKIGLERPCWPPSPSTRAQMLKDICEELRAMGQLPVDGDEERTGAQHDKKGCSGPVCQGSRAAASAADQLRSGWAQAAEAGTPSKVGSKVVEISSLALDIAGAAAVKARLGFSAVLGRAQAGVARSTAASESLAHKRRQRVRLVHDDW